MLKLVFVALQLALAAAAGAGPTLTTCLGGDYSVTLEWEPPADFSAENYEVALSAAAEGAEGESLLTVDTAAVLFVENWLTVEVSVRALAAGGNLTTPWSNCTASTAVPLGYAPVFAGDIIFEWGALADACAASSSAVGDTDGNGRDELVFWKEGRALAVERTSADPPFFADVGEEDLPLLFDEDTNAWVTFRSGGFDDFDDDGYLDCLIGDGPGLLYASVHNETGRLTSVESGGPLQALIDEVGFQLYTTVELVDLDEDGDLDLLMGQFYGPLRYFERTGLATFEERVDELNPLQPANVIELWYAKPVLCDVDKDGDQDLFVGHVPELDATQIWMLEADGAGNFANTTVQPFGGYSWRSDGSHTASPTCIDGELVVASLPCDDPNNNQTLVYIATFGHPDTPPAAPRAEAILGGAQLSWNASLDNGDAVTTYIVRDSRGGEFTVEDGATKATIYPLDVGFGVTLTVSAVNNFGESAESAASVEVVPLAGVPAAVELECAGGDQVLVVEWTDQESHGAAVTKHTVLIGGEVVATAGAADAETGRGAVELALPNDELVNVTVVATNEYGDSPAATCSATPGVATGLWPMRTAGLKVGTDLPLMEDLDSDGESDIIGFSHVRDGVQFETELTVEAKFADGRHCLWTIANVSEPVDVVAVPSGGGNFSLIFKSGYGAETIDRLYYLTVNASLPFQADGCQSLVPETNSTRFPWDHETWPLSEAGQLFWYDMDGDGAANELVDCSYYGVRWTHLGTNVSIFDHYNSYESFWGTSWCLSTKNGYLRLAPGDFDLDGDVDMLVTNRIDYDLDFWDNVGTTQEPVYEKTEYWFSADLSVYEAGDYNAGIAPGGGLVMGNEYEAVTDVLGFGKRPDQVPYLDAYEVLAYTTALRWAVPASNGLDLTSYEITLESGAYEETFQVNVTDSGTNTTLGVQPGRYYTASIVAINAAGPSPATETGFQTAGSVPEPAIDAVCSARALQVGARWNLTDPLNVDYFRVALVDWAGLPLALWVVADGSTELLRDYDAAEDVAQLSITSCNEVGCAAPVTCSAPEREGAWRSVLPTLESTTAAADTHAAVAFGDVDGDGVTDALVGAETGGVLVEATGEVLLATATRTRPAVHSDADFVVVGAADGSLTYFANDGAGTLTEVPGELDEFAPLASGYAAPAVADVDRDGWLDLVVGAADGSVVLYRNFSAADNATLVEGGGNEAHAVPGVCGEDLSVGFASGAILHLAGEGGAAFSWLDAWAGVALPASFAAPSCSGSSAALGSGDAADIQWFAYGGVPDAPADVFVSGYDAELDCYALAFAAPEDNGLPVLEYSVNDTACARTTTLAARNAAGWGAAATVDPGAQVWLYASDENTTAANWSVPAALDDVLAVQNLTVLDVPSPVATGDLESLGQPPLTTSGWCAALRVTANFGMFQIESADLFFVGDGCTQQCDDDDDGWSLLSPGGETLFAFCEEKTLVTSVHLGIGGDQALLAEPAFLVVDDERGADLPWYRLSLDQTLAVGSASTHTLLTNLDSTTELELDGLLVDPEEELGVERDVDNTYAFTGEALSLYPGDFRCNSSVFYELDGALYANGASSEDGEWLGNEDSCDGVAPISFSVGYSVQASDVDVRTLASPLYTNHEEPWRAVVKDTFPISAELRFALAVDAEDDEFGTSVTFENATRDGQETTIAVKAIVDDVLGSSTSSFTWVYDITPPGAPLYERTPDDIDGDNVPDFTVASELGAEVTVCIDADGGECQSATISSSDEDNYLTTYLESGVDEPITSLPYEIEFGSNVNAVEFLYRLDAANGEWTTLPGVSLELPASLANGWHLLEVYSADGESVDASPLVLAFEVQTALLPTPIPDTLLLEAPGSVIGLDEEVVFVLGCSEDDYDDDVVTEQLCSYEYSVDMGEWEPLPVGPLEELSLGVLSPGLHVAAFRATTASGTDPVAAVHTWQHVEVPVVDILLAPPAESDASKTYVVAEVDGGYVCDMTFELVVTTSNGTALVDDGYFFGDTLLVNNLEPGEYTLELGGECEMAAVPATWEWTMTSGANMVQVALQQPLADGEHTAVAVATDVAGNLGLETSAFTWIVDTLAPNVTLERQAYYVPSDLEIDVACDDLHGCDLAVYLDDSTLVGNSTTVQVLGMSEGLHTLTAYGTDAAGNTGNDSITFLSDVSPPEINVTALAGWNASVPVFRIDCFDWSGCFDHEFVGFYSGGGDTWTVDASAGLADGYYRDVEARVTDGSGQSSSTFFSFVLDTTPPAVVLHEPDPAPAAFSPEPNVTLRLGCEDQLSACSAWAELDGEPVGDAGLLQLSEGAHVLQAWASDELGNETPEPLVLEWVVDTVAPVLDVVAVEADGMTAWLTLDCGGDCDEVLVEANGTALDISFNTTTLLRVASDEEQLVSLALTPVDAAGNVGAPKAVSLYLDGTPPVFAVGAVPVVTNSLTVSVPLTVTDVQSFECSTSWASAVLSGGVLVVDAGAEDEGAVSVEVTCEDASGLSDSTTVAYTLDLTAPALVVEAPPAYVPALEVGLEFAATDASNVTFWCYVDTEVLIAECAPGWAAQLEVDGPHTLVVRAVDEAGNVAENSSVVVADTVVPFPQFTATPAEVTTTDEATFEVECLVTEPDACGSDAESADPECSLLLVVDGGAPLAVSAADGPVELTVDGDVAAHSAELTSVDLAGNTQSVTYSWSISENLVLFVDSGPTVDMFDTHATFTLSSIGYAVDGFEMRVDSDSADDWTEEGVTMLTETVEGSTGTAYVEDLAYGPHTAEFRIRGSDATATLSWSVGECEKNEARYRNADGTIHCEECPAKGAICDSSSTVLLEPGYWRSNSSTDLRAQKTFYECANPEACLGGSECAEGYAGVLCGICADTHALDLSGACVRCNAEASKAATTTLGVIMVLVVSAGFLFVTKRSLDIAAGGGNILVAVLKIFTAHALMIDLLREFQLDWGALADTVFSAAGVVSGTSASELHILSCTFRDVRPLAPFAVYFVIPFLVVIVPGLAVGAAVIWLRYKKLGILIWGQSARFIYKHALLVISFFTYTPVLWAAFRVLNCVTIEGRSYLVHDLRQECAGEEYDTYATIAIVYMSVFGPGLPVSLLVSVWRKREELWSGRVKTLMQYSFFTGEYKKEAMYWELAVMLRKVLLSAVSVLGSLLSPGMQVYMGVWVLLAAFSADIVWRPHREVLVQRLETSSLATALASLLLGQALAIEGITEHQRDIMRYLVVVINVLMLLALQSVFVREIWISARDLRGQLGPMAMSLSKSRRRRPAAEIEMHENPMQKVVSRSGGGGGGSVLSSGLKPGSAGSGGGGGGAVVVATSDPDSDPSSASDKSEGSPPGSPPGSPTPSSPPGSPPASPTSAGEAEAEAEVKKPHPSRLRLTRGTGKSGSGRRLSRVLRMGRDENVADAASVRGRRTRGPRGGRGGRGRGRGRGRFGRRRPQDTDYGAPEAAEEPPSAVSAAEVDERAEAEAQQIEAQRRRAEYQRVRRASTDVAVEVERV